MSRAEVKLFQRSAERVAEFLRPKLDGDTQVKVLAHTDADGISAAAIIGRCLHHYDTPFSVQFTRPKSDEDMERLMKGGHDLFIFLDEGSGQMEMIHRHLLNARKSVVIIDHHPGTFPPHQELAFLNPHLDGLNGAKDVSASGAAYLVAEQLDLKFRYLVVLAMIGAIGDRQEFFSGFTGVNDLLAKRAIDLELVLQGEGLKLVGRSSKPILECLRTSTRPYIRGLSGTPSACRSLLKDLGISPSVLISELTHDQQRALADAIFTRMGETATNEEFQHNLWGPVYTNASDEIAGPRDLREYATVLDSCANTKKPEIGFSMALGDETAMSDSFTLFSGRQEEMLHTLSWLSKNLTRIEEARNFRYLYCGDEVNPSLVGEAISLVIESGMVKMDRAFLGLSDTTEGMVKISARGTPRLAMEGTNLGGGIEKVASKLGGTGGGHDVAAAARVPKEKMNEFLTALDHALTEGKE